MEEKLQVKGGLDNSQENLGQINLFIQKMYRRYQVQQFLLNQ